MSLIFDNGPHDVKAVFNCLDEFRDFEVNYIVLNNSWFTGNSLSDSDMRLMKDCVRIETICRFAEVIDESQAGFSERTIRIGVK